MTVPKKECGTRAISVPSFGVGRFPKPGEEPAEAVQPLDDSIGESMMTDAERGAAARRREPGIKRGNRSGITRERRISAAELPGL